MKIELTHVLFYPFFHLLNLSLSRTCMSYLCQPQTNEYDNHMERSFPRAYHQVYRAG